MILIQLVILLVLSSILRSFVDWGRIPTLLFSFVLASLFTIQLSSVILTGEIANYRFYENFNLADILSVTSFFGKEALILVLSLIVTTFIIFQAGRFLKKRQIRKSVVFIGLLSGIILLGTSGGILRNIYDTLELKMAKDASFAQALSALDIDENNYVKKNDIKATKGKNIIVLSLESLEKGFLEDKLDHLTPNLRKLAKQHTFLPMEQSPAGGWTSASMYIALTGVPAYFNTHGNEVYQSSHENKITSLGDVLQAAGYDLQYFIGKKEFAGIGDMLKTHGFTAKSEANFETKYEKVAWGIQDLDLFREFKKELLLKKNSEQPFAMFLSTIGTHFPNGMADRRVDSLLPPQSSRLELMVSATDYLIGDLVAFLEKENLMEDTVFFIYPDHLFMGRNSEVVNDFSERSLYFLTNADESVLGPLSIGKVHQIDIPKLILKGAEIQHNAKFLTDFISDDDTDALIRKNAKNLLQLNMAALTILNLKEGFVIEKNKSSENFLLKHNNGAVLVQGDLPLIGNSHRIVLDRHLRPLKNLVIDLTKDENRKYNSSYIDIYQINNTLYSTLNGQTNFGITKKGDPNISFSKKDVNLLQEANSAGKSGIILNSNSWNAKQASNFVVDGKREGITRGITIICPNDQSILDFKTFDTHGNEFDAKDFLETLKKFEKNKVSYIVLSHDSAAKGLKEHSEELRNLGLTKLSNLKNRQAYIAHNLYGSKVEMVDDLTIQLQLHPTDLIKNNKVYFSETKIEFETSIDRYIAHAGGQVDGVNYTNSKDALDHNYEKGFRMFELDIIETSDGKFVAAHDWNHWKNETNYQGEVPVTQSEFRKYSIRGKFATLAMNEINEWFKTHPDAVLVTDKINDPVKFAERFVDKNRLIMELFSLEEVELALQNNIVPLVSEKILSEIKGDVVTYLVENKIHYVGISRRNIVPKTDFLKKCRENDIKVYVYQVNFDAGKDERYVLENEIGLVYGMYADKWLQEFSP